MKKLLSFLFILALPVLVAAQQTVINDPNAQPRTVGSFHAIKISSAIDLYLSQSTEESVVVSAVSDEFRDKIQTVVEDGVLKIYFNDRGRWWRNTGNKKMRAYVSFKSIDKLIGAGASDIFVTGTIKAGDLFVEMSGASDFKKGIIEATNLTVKLTGASDMNVTGVVSSLKIEASGASDFKGFDLRTEVCDADASGASDIKITVNKELNAKASGASGVHYKGEAMIRDLRTSGASNVNKRG